MPAWAYTRSATYKYWFTVVYPYGGYLVPFSIGHTASILNYYYYSYPYRKITYHSLGGVIYYASQYPFNQTVAGNKLNYYNNGSYLTYVYLNYNPGSIVIPGDQPWGLANPSATVNLNYLASPDYVKGLGLTAEEFWKSPETIEAYRGCQKIVKLREKVANEASPETKKDFNLCQEFFDEYAENLKNKAKVEILENSLAK